MATEKKMSPIFLLYYAVALFAPLIIFVWLGNNLNEREPGLVWVVCIPLWIMAGYLSSRWMGGKTQFQWIAGSLVGGILLSLGLIFLV